MQMRRWLVGLALVVATIPVTGCGSHPDHPTVDVSGKWLALWSGSDGSGGDLTLLLVQTSDKLEGAAEIMVDPEFADPYEYLACADKYPAKDDSNRVFCTAETEALRECLAPEPPDGTCTELVVDLDDCRSRRRAHDCTSQTGELDGDVEADRIDLIIKLKPQGKDSCEVWVTGTADGDQVGAVILGNIDFTDCRGGVLGTWEGELQPPEE